MRFLRRHHGAMAPPSPAPVRPRGWGGMPWLYCSEIFPQKYRTKARHGLFGPEFVRLGGMGLDSCQKISETVYIICVHVRKSVLIYIYIYIYQNKMKHCVPVWSEKSAKTYCKSGQCVLISSNITIFVSSVRIYVSRRSHAETIEVSLFSIVRMGRSQFQWIEGKISWKP